MLLKYLLLPREKIISRSKFKHFWIKTKPALNRINPKFNLLSNVILPKCNIAATICQIEQISSGEKPNVRKALMVAL